MLLKELLELLKTAKTINEIDEKRLEIKTLIPKVDIMIDFDQDNHAHQYMLWEHCLHAVVGIDKLCDDEMLYLAALLHDIGKPDCQVEGKRPDDRNKHYYGHPKRSMEIVRDEVIPYLQDMGSVLSEDEIRRLLYYVEYHDDRVSLRMKHLRRHLNMGASLEEFQNLMRLQVADAKAHIMLPVIMERIEICGKLASEYSEELYKDIISGK